jgi:hypothetical protein
VCVLLAVLLSVLNNLGRSPVAALALTGWRGHAIIIAIIITTMSSSQRDPYFTPRVQSQLAANYGLHLTDEGYEKCFAACNSRLSDDLAQAAVQLDLKQLTNGCLPDFIVTDGSASGGAAGASGGGGGGSGVVGGRSRKSTLVCGPLFVQVVSCRNIAQPSIRQESSSRPRCLLLHVTDGANKALALEHASVPALSPQKLSPGTKLVLRNVSFERGFLLLEPK